MDPKIFIIIKEKTQKEVIKRIKKVERHANIAEIWLDQLQDLDFEGLLKKMNCPMIACYKRAKDGGQFKGTYQSMVNRLIAVMKLGVEYVEIPSNIDKKLIKKLVQEQKNSSYSKVIISYQNKQNTPSLDALVSKAKAMAKTGAKIVKIVTHAKDKNDAIKMIALSKELYKLNIQHMAWATGKHGALSQLLAPTVGSLMVPSALNQREAEVSELLSIPTIRAGWNCILRPSE